MLCAMMPCFVMSCRVVKNILHLSVGMSMMKLPSLGSDLVMCQSRGDWG